MIEPFETRYRRAIGDDALRATLKEFQRNWRRGRDRAVALQDFEGKRHRLATVKDAVIRDLPAYIDRYAAAVTAAGGTVYRAATPEEAATYVIGLARERGAHRIVKSKSMATEEIGLNETLEAAGLHVSETDLGEWLVQLSGERPSHIVGPALHMNRRQTAALLSGVAGRTVEAESIEGQVAFARTAMRENFLAGEIGMSGANALVVEDGSIMLVTNEGNAELVTSLPPLHIVVAGIEKILPTLDDALLELEVLAPTATGQIASSYVTFLRPHPGSGPEVHVVLIDNGRMAMRESPLFADALRCIRCGACSSVCPSYGAVGGHVFGYVYSGAIGLVNTQFHHGLENAAGPQSLCVSCNACAAVCPVEIPLPRQILDTRAEVAAKLGIPPAKRAGIEVWSRPKLIDLATRTGAVLQRPLVRGEFVTLPGASKLTSWRKPPRLASKPFRDRFRDQRAEPLPGDLGRTLQGVRIAYFVQCLTDRLYPELGESIVRSLRRLGAEVVFPRAQHCCGLPAIDAGMTRAAIRMATQTLEVLESTRADYIVTGATSCSVAVIHDYPHLFRNHPRLQQRAGDVAARMVDFTTFMNEVAALPQGRLSPHTQRMATYHYFCQSYNVLGFRREPFQLLESVCGVQFTDLPEANMCCGFGGSVSFERPEMSRQILQRKLDNVHATGAPVLITDNPGCIMHLRGGLAAAGSHVQVWHPAQVVDARLEAMRR